MQKEKKVLLLFTLPKFAGGNECGSRSFKQFSSSSWQFVNMKNSFYDANSGNIQSNTTIMLIVFYYVICKGKLIHKWINNYCFCPWHGQQASFKHIN